MAGSFEGVSDLEWRLFEDVFPPAPPKRGRGMPHAPFRTVLNTLLYVLITGCRWCDVPRGPQWASKSATHRWLQRWHADGTLAAMQGRILGIAEERGMMRWEYGAVDGAFSPWQGWRRGRRARKRLKVIATDKGYDAKALRQQLRKRGIRAQLPKRVWKTKKNRGRPIKKAVPRFQADRTVAWFQKKYRRLVVRWERIAACFDAFLAVATIHIWIQRLIVG